MREKSGPKFEIHDTIIDLPEEGDAQETVTDLGALQRGVEGRVFTAAEKAQSARARQAALEKTRRAVQTPAETAEADAEFNENAQTIGELARIAGELEDKLEKYRTQGPILRWFNRKRAIEAERQHDEVVDRMHELARQK